MDLVDEFAQRLGTGELVRQDSLPLLRGAVAHERLSDGWYRPWRVTSAQLRALVSVRAWHPGLFRAMARCTAGMVLEFETDAQKLALEVRLDGEPVQTRAVLAAGDAGSLFGDSAHDGLSLDCDGLHHYARMPRVSADFGEGDQPVGLVAFDLAPGEARTIPGLGSTRSVRLYLPSLRGCELRSLLHDGTFVRPAPGRDSLLVIGDSVAQGFVADDPAWAWPSMLASSLGATLVNQSIGGQVYQPGFVADLARVCHPAAVVVALGANYRYERCSAALVATEIRGMLGELAEAVGDVPVWVLGPVWFDGERWPVHKQSCFDALDDMLKDAVERHPGWTVVDGRMLMDSDPIMLSDDGDHPGPLGHEQIAERLFEIMGAKADDEVRSVVPAEPEPEPDSEPEPEPEPESYQGRADAASQDASSEPR